MSEMEARVPFPYVMYKAKPNLAKMRHSFFNVWLLNAAYWSTTHLTFVCIRTVSVPTGRLEVCYAIRVPGFLNTVTFSSLSLP